MAKGSRGGQRGTASTVSRLSARQNATQQAQTQQPQVDTTQQPQAFSTNYNNFMAMTDDQKADAISKLASQGVPANLADNDFQRLTFNLGLNDKPQVVDDATLDKMKGTELFRTVNEVYDRNSDTHWNADDIINQIQKGSVTRVSDNGGSAYGRGIYFADTYSESSFYGNSRGNIKKTAVGRAKLNSNANIITHSKAVSGARNEINSGSKLGKALRKCDSASQASIYAMAKGYNVIISGHGYYNVLNRNAITMSDQIKAGSNKWK